MDNDRQTFDVRQIARIALMTADLERSVDFYTQALGFAVASKNAQGAVLHLGGQQIELRLAGAGAHPYPAPAAANDPWFQHFAIRVADMPSAYAQLNRRPHQAISIGGPQRLPPSTGSVTAYKFRDPDGHPLELSYVPGPQPGHEPNSSFLSVDHTALAVRDLEASVAFYTQELGFSLKQRLLNHGEEQDRLDGLPGVELDIVVLTTPASGPHIELLHYRTPKSQADPVSVREGDIAATCTILQVADLHPSPAQAENVLLRDPDGHLLEIRG